MFVEAIHAFANSMESAGSFKQGHLMIEQSKQDFSDIKDFYNPRIPGDIYNELNGVWKSQITNQKGKFRQHMSCLAEKISDQVAKLEKFKNLYSKLFKQTKWDEETNFPKLNNFLCIIDLWDNEILDPKIQKAKRILLFEKAKCLLPHAVLQMIEEKLEEQGVRIKTILKHSHQKINLHEGILKLTILINHEEWFIEDIEWGITNQAIFQALVVEQWCQFPTMIKIM